MAIGRLVKLFLASAVAVATLAAGTAAQAAPNPCATLAVGDACTEGSATSPTGSCRATESSVCEDPDASASGDAAVSSAEAGAPTCLICVPFDQNSAQGCGNEGPSGLSGGEFFTHTVAGCCSVAGTSDWADGVGVIAGAALLGLAFLQRRRPRR
jgi:MYXO-CTERM domain-containing protein